MTRPSLPSLPAPNPNNKINQTNEPACTSKVSEYPTYKLFTLDCKATHLQSRKIMIDTPSPKQTEEDKSSLEELGKRQGETQASTPNKNLVVPPFQESVNQIKQ